MKYQKALTSLLVLLTTLITIPASAAKKQIVPTNLRDQAISEAKPTTKPADKPADKPAAKIAGKPTTKAAVNSTAKPTTQLPVATPDTGADTGILSLKSEFKAMNSRDHAWTTSISIESFTPKGTGLIGESTHYPLSGLGATLMPTIGMGYLSPAYDIGGISYKNGIELSLGVATQEASLITPTSQIIDGRFTTTILNVRPYFRIPWQSQIRLFTEVGLDLGIGQIIMSSESSQARFSGKSAYAGYSLALGYSLTNTLDFMGTYYEKKSTEVNPVWNTSLSALQLGASYKW